MDSMLYNDRLYGGFRTRTFSQIYTNVDEFIDDYKTIGIPTTVSDDTIKTIYLLILSRKANSPIASSDENRFRLDLFAIIFSKAPTWERRLDIQKKLRELTDDELMYGAQAIYNTATNPANGLAYDEDDKPIKLNQLNLQNTTNYKKSKLEAYSILWESLRDDVTSIFLRAFDRLFNQFTYETPLLYATESED